jgi:opacity protein-like surface antigen
MRSIVLACATCATVTVAATAQQGGVLDGIERGNTGIGSRIGFFFGAKSGLRSGIEVGYSRTGRGEGRISFGDPLLGAGFQNTITSTKLWHATVVARKEWPTPSRRLSLYAVGGTGVYMGRTSTERFSFDADARRLGSDLQVGGREWEFGANLGAGIELRPPGSLGAIDLDARLHVLPFSAVSGVRTLMTFSAGLSFF